MTKAETEKLHKLYEIYEQPMYRIAFSVLKNTSDAEDAVSDAFMSIIRKVGSIGEPYSPKTKSYIVKTIRNSAIDIYRKNRRNYDRAQPMDDSINSIPDSASGFENDIGDNDGILNILNETDRKIITLRCRDELQWRDIAQRMNMTEANVRKRFERARKKLISQRGVADYE
ncbi:MAG: sigma-70 family RNA polymerase sigma factor [Ruminococcus sp.]|nr:sigma-70 family RNA polymerase sigma factor [Ruminococcus sp.]